MSPKFRYACILAALLSLTGGAASLHGGTHNEAIVSRLAGMERLQLGKLQALDQSVLAAIPGRVAPARLRARTEELMALSAPAVGTRQTLPDGRALIHQYLSDTFDQLAPFGLERLASFRADVAAPVSLDRLRDAALREPPARLLVGGETIAVHPLWPNGPMPALAPQGGLSGPLVYCGAGSWEELNGKPLDGAIALMDFQGGRNLERLFSLGAAGVVVLEDSHVQYGNATLLFSQTPFPFPRFYADKSTRARLLAILAASDGHPQAQLHGGQLYEDRTIESFFVRLPAPPAQPFTVPDDFAAEWAAAVNGLGASEVRAANPGLQAYSRPGTVLRIPGGRQFIVPDDGMWEMVARLHDVPEAGLRAANPGLAAAPLVAGMAVAVPSAVLPLVIMVPIDAASVVPDAPHGARHMTNLAVALEWMDFMARTEGLRPRRDIIFGFLDGDTLGGQGSRLVAEYNYLLDNRFARTSGRGGAQDDVIGRYRAAERWFADGTVPPEAGERRWLLEDWLIPRFEEKRIAIAEDRILRLTGARGSEQLPDLAQLEADLALVAGLRDRTVMSGGAEADRLQALHDDWAAGAAEDFARFGLDRETLQQRMVLELQHEERSLANHDHNLAAARRLRDAIVKRPEDERRLALGWRLDIGDGSGHLGVHASTVHLRSPVTGPAAESYRVRFRKVAAYAASRAGWPEDFTFISFQDQASLPLQDTRVPPLYQDLWFSANVHTLPLGGQSDRLERIDTPHDVVERVDWERVSLQARTAFVLLAVSAESLLDSQYAENKRERELSRITGGTVQFNIRSGIDAKDPVAGAYVYLPSAKGGAFAEKNADAFYGHRRGILHKSLLNGSFQMPVEVAGYNNEPRLYAYHLERQEAVFSKVATQGQIGTKPQENRFRYRPKEAVEKNLVMIDAYPRVIFIGTNPSTLDPVMGGMYSTFNIELVDAVINGTPRDFAVDNPLVHYRETERDGVVLYLPEGMRVRAAVRKGLDYDMLLTGPVLVEEDGKARGQGIRIGPAEDGDRNLLLSLSPYAIAKGMWELASFRLDLYQSYGISSRALRESVDRAGDKIAEAEAAITAMEWQEAVGKSREAWGIMVKGFPRILKLGREAVFSVILLMALAVPAAVFLERLVIGSKSIVARLTGTTLLFIVATFFLNIFHPAFRISLSPFIIVIAFTMILMSVIVLALSYGRFEVVLRRFRSAGGEVQGEEISFMSSMSTAFSLGVSNLKKRAFRTGLTVFTVTALTFAIVGFVAVSGSDALRRQALPLDGWVEGEQVQPLPPAYEGFLMRAFNWLEVSASKVAAVEAEFGAEYAVTTRAHYIEVEGGNNANREGVNQIPVMHGGRENILTGIMAFQPNETDFSGLHRAVSGGAWFRRGDDAAGIPEDRFAVILPDEAAGELGITPAMLLDEAGNRRPEEELPVVRMASRVWRVIGILDTDLANRIRDVNGRSLAMVDYLRSGMSSGVSGSNQIISEGQSYHFDWRRLAIVPFAARQDVGAKIRSLAVMIPEGKDPGPLFADLTLRLKNEFFAASDGEVSLIIPRQKIDFAGVAKILLPVFLCVLIVMNTMLGTVEERKGEVGMLGAIGLSPRQIAFLMFAESTVFSILGIIFGTFGGLLFANIVNSINAAGGSFLTSLSFNFTSLISMGLATGTGVVVLLATLVPANKAAALAAPSGMTEWQLPESETEGEIRFKLPFTLTRGNAVGMAAFFHQFLVNHNEPTSDDFNCREVVITMQREDGLPVIRIVTDMWLAPYDLDVAQHFTLELRTGERASVYEVELNMRRFSGSEDNSRRTAYSLLNLVRRQFLLWRNLEPARRAEFIQQGARLLGDNTATTAVS